MQDSLFLLSLRTLVTIAGEKNKLPALTETGNNLVSESDWFTSRILEPIKNDSIARRISWLLVWRNIWHTHYFAPYLGHHAEEDFMIFYNDELILFEDGLPSLYK
jgi:mannan endo-1,4-beta-mannosidase